MPSLGARPEDDENPWITPRQVVLEVVTESVDAHRQPRSFAGEQL